MISRNVILEKEIPYDELKEVGLSKKAILNLPKEVLTPLLSGRVTPLIRASVERLDGIKVDMPLKLQLTRNERGKVQALAYPIRKGIVNDMKLASFEMKKLKEGEVVKKEGRNRVSMYLQLDRETNSIIRKKMVDVNMKDRLKEVEAVNDIQLGLNQKKNLMEGKPIELELGGDKKVTVGVDLQQPNGFKMIKGGLDDWEKEQKVKYDIAHPEFKGFVQTDKNRWEYQQIIKDNEKISLGRGEVKSSVTKTMKF